MDEIFAMGNGTGTAFRKKGHIMKRNRQILKPRTRLSLGDLILAVSSCTNSSRETVATVALPARPGLLDAERLAISTVRYRVLSLANFPFGLAQVASKRGRKRRLDVSCRCRVRCLSGLALNPGAPRTARATASARSVRIGNLRRRWHQQNTFRVSRSLLS